MVSPWIISPSTTSRVSSSLLTPWDSCSSSISSSPFRCPFTASISSSSSSGTVKDISPSASVQPISSSFTSTRASNTGLPLRVTRTVISSPGATSPSTTWMVSSPSLDFCSNSDSPSKSISSSPFSPSFLASISSSSSSGTMKDISPSASVSPISSSFTSTWAPDTGLPLRVTRTVISSPGATSPSTTSRISSPSPTSWYD